MVRREEENHGGLSCDVVSSLLLNKFVVIIGDSIQRGIYKDLISLLQRDHVLKEKDLKAKGELSFLGDTLIEGGVKAQLNNGTNYTEVRQYVTSTHLVRFYFVTRCYNQYMESILQDLVEGPNPDLVIMNSCLWDMTRYGKTAITEYKQNMALLFSRLTEVLPPYCLMVWNTTLPISKNARGGFLVQEIEYKNYMLRMDVLEANYYARQVVVSHGFDVLDLHFWFRQRLDWRAQDGIHWCAGAHRHISRLLLTHVANAWSIPFPSIQFPLCREMPSLRLPAPSLPVSLLEVAKRLEDGYGRGATRNTAPYRRPAPYPLRSLPLNEPASWNNGGVQGGEYYCEGYDAENFVNKFSLPQLNFEAFPIAQASVSANFFNEWTDYNNDSFSGVQRRTHHHRSWSRNTRD